MEPNAVLVFVTKVPIRKYFVCKFPTISGPVMHLTFALLWH